MRCTPMPLDAREIMVFIEAARSHSFTLAAARLAMTPSAVSKAISRLEQELGVVLLHRSAQSVMLTEEGARFLEAGQTALAEIGRAHV